MIKNVTMKQNDTYPPLRLQLLDASGIVPVINASVRLHVVSSKGVLINSPMTVIDPVQGIVEYEWKPEDTANFGKFMAEVQVTFSQGEVLSFPNEEYFTVTINKDLL